MKTGGAILESLRLGLNLKLLLFTTMIVSATSSISAYLPYVNQKQALESSLASELLSIVQTVAISVNAEQHENIYLDEESGLEGKAEFETIRSLLAKVSDANHLKRHAGLSPVYTLRTSFNDSSKLEFVVMSDPNKAGDFYTGALINKESFHQDVFLGHPRATNIYRDSEGLWITAAAPIFDELGRVVAIVQSDRPIDFFYQKLAGLRNQFVIGAVIGIFLGSLLAILFARSVIQPIGKLLHATRKFATGNYEHRIRSVRRDEFGELFNSFNEMTESISSALTHLNQSNVELQSLALFSELSPGPVLRVEKDGSITRFNEPARVVFDLGSDPDEIKNINSIIAELDSAYILFLISGDRHENIIKKFQGRWFQLDIRGVSKFGFANFYGTDISSTVLAEEQARIAQSEAETANHAKSRFLATMSHELRTPMNAITGYTYLAQRKSKDEDLNSQLTKIATASNSLLGLIDNILDFSKIEEDHIELEETQVNLYDLCEDVLAVFSKESTDKGVDFFVCISRDVCESFWCDGVRLRQVLLNLIDNAIKFTGDGGVMLNISQCQGVLLFEVSDSGIGISQDYIKNLFDPFAQADTSTTRKYSGIGLGLSISQRLIQCMGGKIEVDSTLGEGSRFYFSLKGGSAQEVRRLNVNTLRVYTSGLMSREFFFSAFIRDPFTTTFVELSDVDCEHQNTSDVIIINIGDEDQFNRFNASFAETSYILCMLPPSLYEKRKAFRVSVHCFLEKPVSSSVLIDNIFNRKEDERPEVSESGNGLSGVSSRLGANTQLLGAKVLIVEDDPVNQELSIELMNEVGAKYKIANHGEEALALLASEPFDIILMDKQMPVMDGCDAARAIRQNESWNNIPIIAITANALKGDVDTCLSAGMDDYLSKPVDAEQLFERMQHWLEKSGFTPDVHSRLFMSLGEGSNILGGAVIDFSIVRTITGSDSNYKKVLAEFIDTFLPHIDTLTFSYDNARICCLLLNDNDVCLASTELLKAISSILSADPQGLAPETLGELVETLEDELEHLLMACNQEQAFTPRETSVCEVSIDGFDCASAIVRMQNKVPIYLKLLQSFVVNNSASVDACLQNLELGKIEDARRCAHTTKGVAATIGATELSRVAALLEKSIKEDGSANEVLTDEYAAIFSDTLARVKAYLESNG